MYRIAVLMSTYNGEKYLEQQITSILHQEGNFELHLIVRDDGSKDKTQLILNDYQRLGKLKWYPGKNIKTALSFLTLVRDNPGYDYYAFADQDDYWNVDKLQVGIERIEEIRKDYIPLLYFCNTECVDKNLMSIGGMTYRREPKLDFYSVLTAPGFLGCTMVFNKTLAELIQSRELPLKVSMHDSYIAKICLSNDGEIIYDLVPHMKYRQHESNVIGAATGKLDAIKRRLGTIKERAQIGVAEDAQELLKLYSGNIDFEKKQWIEQLANYKNSLFNAIRLCFSNKPKFSSRNMEITVRLSILLRHF